MLNKELDCDAKQISSQVVDVLSHIRIKTQICGDSIGDTNSVEMSMNCYDYLQQTYESNHWKLHVTSLGNWNCGRAENSRSFEARKELATNNTVTKQLSVMRVWSPCCLTSRTRHKSGNVQQLDLSICLILVQHIARQLRAERLPECDEPAIGRFRFS